MKEIDLVNEFNNFLDQQNYVFANEIRMGIGTPDIMITLNPNRTSSYIDDYRALKLLKLITRKQQVKRSSLAESSTIPRRQLNQLLHTLVAKNSISMDSQTVTILNPIDFQNQGVNISVEVKVKDWRIGLLQAQRYLAFSDYSYLALSSEFVDNVDVEQLRSVGIGLLSIDHSSVKECLRPKRSKKCDDLSKYISISHLKKKYNQGFEGPDSFFRIKGPAVQILTSNTYKAS